MPELETEKAIAARVEQAKFFLLMGKPKQALEVLERLEKILPEPEERHAESAKQSFLRGTQPKIFWSES